MLPIQSSCYLYMLNNVLDQQASTALTSLHWRHYGGDCVSNHQPHDCLLNRLFRRRSKETSKLRVTGLCAGNSPGPVNSPHKWPVTRKMFPFDDVIMVLVPSDFVWQVEVACMSQNNIDRYQLAKSFIRNHYPLKLRHDLLVWYHHCHGVSPTP